MPKSNSKSKSKELTVAEIKKMIYEEIEKKRKRVDPAIHNMRIVEDNLAEVEAISNATNTRYDYGRRKTKR